MPFKKGHGSAGKTKFWNKKKRARQPSPSPDIEQLEDELENEDEMGNRKKVRWEGNDDEEEEEKKSENATTTSDEPGSESEPPGKVVLSLYCKNHRVGCAYYDPVKLVMFVLEDTSETMHFDVTKLVLEQIKPDIVLTSSRSDDRAIEVIREFLDGSTGILQIRPQKDYTISKGREQLYSLRLLSELPDQDLVDDNSSSVSSGVREPTNAYDFMRQRRDANCDPMVKRWNASIRLGNFASTDGATLCVSSIGALLDHLSKINAIGSLGEGVDGLEVRAIESIKLDEVMLINADALSSLQIFDDESHASTHSDKTKEGLSLYGILDSTQTSLGHNLLRHWLLRPSLSILTITARHDAVECFMRPENIVTSDAMHNHLKGFKNIPRILNFLRSGRATIIDWQALVKFTFHSALLREALTELSSAADVEIVKRLLEALDVSRFRDIGNTIHEIIDWEESLRAGRVCVRPHIDEELDNWKHMYDGIDAVLSRVAEQICETVTPDFAPTLNVVYFPQLGFLICVPMQDSWKTNEGIPLIEGWAFQFSSEAHVYFKSGEMHDMDRHIGDLHPAIVDREIEIVQDLLTRILVYYDLMTLACDVSAELDCLLCFAEASRAFDYHRPNLTSENVIDIKQGRHPLQEQVVPTFVPNDLYLRGGLGSCAVNPYVSNNEEDDSDSRDSKSIIVCTGANACGKSIFIKQAALIQYMAQIGCFVPAESATLGIVDRILTRCQTRETISKVQSAFMIDLNQVSLALRNCTERSLILLDEFGKGTAASDGAGLFCGVLLSFLSRRSNCPKVLAATHFHDVFKEGLLDPALPIGFVNMQILLASDLDTPEVDDSGYDSTDEKMAGENYAGALTQGETITYLYRAVPGLSLNSHAAECAQMFGLPNRLVRRAQHVSSLLSEHNIDQLLDEEMNEEEKMELHAAEDVCRRFIAWEIKDAENAKDGLKSVIEITNYRDNGDIQ